MGLFPREWQIVGCRVVEGAAGKAKKTGNGAVHSVLTQSDLRSSDWAKLSSGSANPAFHYVQILCFAKRQEGILNVCLMGPGPGRGAAAVCASALTVLRQNVVSSSACGVKMANYSSPHKIFPIQT